MLNTFFLLTTGAIQNVKHLLLLAIRDQMKLTMGKIIKVERAREGALSTRAAILYPHLRDWLLL